MFFGWNPPGYEFPGYIAGVDRLYQEVRFAYKPLSSREVESLNAQTKDKGGEAAAVIAAGVLAPRIKSWSLQGPNGEAVPVTADNFLCLNPVLALKFANIIQGYSPSDTDPLEKVEAKTAGELIEDSQKN